MMPRAPAIPLIKLNKPALTTEVKLRAFVWKRVVLDRQGGSSEVAKNDLKGLDPNWKGKVVVWKDIKENDKITMEMVQELFSDKSKPKKVEVIDIK